MKNSNIILVVTALLLLINLKVVAQAPQLINYQAVARDLAGNALVSTPVNIVYDIRQSTPTGTVVYSETHALTTNQFGLFTAEIGGGTPVVGTFAGINWSTGLYYLQVTINGDVMPATQLLSVPYALHANTAASGSPGANGHANLADSVAEPAGVNCVNGGYLIYMGVDDDDDGILQPLERDISYYICNGIDGSVNNNDTSATNELQTLSISNDTVYLTNGGFVPLPSNSGLWNTNANGIDYTAGNVGIGTATPLSMLSVNSSDSIITWFSGSNPDLSAIAITNTVPGAAVGTILLTGGDTGYFAIDPTQRLMIMRNTSNGGHIALDADSTIASYANNISQVATDFIFNSTDTIFNISPTGNIINVNQGTFLTDSLYVFGANSNQSNWVLASDGTGHAEWTDPSSLGSGSLWTQGVGDVYNTTDSIGIGVANPSALFHVSGGGLGKPIALFEKGGFLNATININNSSSNGSGINFQNGGTITSSINSSTSNVLSLTSQFVEVGNSPKSGMFNVAGSSTIANPTILVHEATTGFSRIKHTNAVANKYWVLEAGINSADAFSGYSIGYNDGSSTSLPFIVYGDNKVGVNNLATPLGSFHVMDINTTGNGIISEGFNQPGLLVIGRNNFASPNRGAIVNGDEIGRILFPGHEGANYADGPHIEAHATENFTSTSNGSELSFKTIANGTNTPVDALRLLNDGTVEVPINLRVLNGSGTAGDVLTSDAAGNATWQTPASATSPWTSSGTNIFQNTLTDYVGIGTSTPLTKLHIVEDGQAILAVQSSNNTPSEGGNIAMVRTRGTSGTQTQVLSGDRLGKIEFLGLDNTSSIIEAASIRGVADENFGSTTHGAHLEFHTTQVGTGVSNEAMRIADDGHIGLGISTPSEKLHIMNGTVRIDDGTNPYTLPTSDAANSGDVLTSDASGNVSWQTPASSSIWFLSGNTGYRTIGNIGVGEDISGSNIKFRVLTGDSVGVSVESNSNTYAALDVRNMGTGLAGKFREGNVHIQNNLGIGNSASNPTFDLEVDGTTWTKVLRIGSTGSEYDMPNLQGSLGQVLTVNAAGNAVWQSPVGGSSPWTKSGGDVYQTTLTDFIGIGTTTPTEMLSIGSQGTATGTAAQQSSHGIAFTGSFWNGGGVVSHDFTIHNEASTSVNEEGRLSFIWSGSGSEVFSISSQGRVGIGTSNPISPLNIIYTGNDLEGGLVNYTQTSATANGTGFYTSANVTGTGEIIGGGFQVRLSGNSSKSSAVFADNIATSNLNIGVESKSLGTGTSSTNLGGYFEATGGLNNHAIQLVDGTEGDGKVLTSDATGTASWKPNAIGFEVRGSTNQNVDNTPSLLQYDLVIFDDGGNFDPTSGNYSFTAPVGGVYSFQTNVLFDYSSAGPNDVTVVEILKGGAPLFRSNTPIENGERATNTHSGTFKLDVGDVIQVRIYLNSGGGIITTGAADEVLFSGHLVYAD